MIHLLNHILPALVFAAQSPYPGCQNVANLKRYVPVVKNTKNVIKYEIATKKECFLLDIKYYL
jgi:hypothetical protein